MEKLAITECPRDAMQGIHQFIPTATKVRYLNALLRTGFQRLDFGSFVSPKAIPQMQDTAQVLEQLDLQGSHTQLLAIVANRRGAEDAVAHHNVRFLGYPFSISETFQHRNTNSSIQESLKRVDEIQELCARRDKHLLIYISMAFGNPYGDHWHEDIAIGWCRTLHKMGIRHFALADTVGSATVSGIRQLFSVASQELKDCEVSAHLHSTPEKAHEKIGAAYDSGCRSFDVAIHGYGGCPMAADELTGNIATESLIEFAKERGVNLRLDEKALAQCYALSSEIFNNYR